MNFSSLLKEKVDKSSAYKVAKELGVSHTTIYKILNGEMDNPSPVVATRLCTLLNVDPDDLKNFDFNPSESFVDEVKERFYFSEIDRDSIDQYPASFVDFNKVLNKNNYILENIIVTPKLDKGLYRTIAVYKFYNKVIDKHIIVFDFPYRKTFDRKKETYPDHFIRDFSNILLHIITEKPLSYFKSKDGKNDKLIFGLNSDNIDLTSEIKNYIFLTTSYTLYSQFISYIIKCPIDINIQAICYKHKNQMYSTMLSGTEIIKAI